MSVFPINTRLSGLRRLISRVAHRLMGFTGGTERGPAARLLAGRLVNAECKAQGISKVLHLGSFDLPGPKRPGTLQRFLFHDSTWALCHVNAALPLSCRALRTYESLEKDSFAQICHFFPTGEYVKQNLVSQYGVQAKRITVVGTGRGKIVPFGGKKDYGKGPILFVAKGRFEDKGGPLLIEAFQLARQTMPHLQLVIAGSAASPSLQNTPGIRFAGFIPWEELQRLFETAALFAMPAPNEPWGLVYLEALACKSPLLGLARLSLPELTNHGEFGFLVREPTARAVADGILEAFSDPGRLESMGTKGQEYCLKKFSWQNVAAALKEGMFPEFA